MNDADRKAFEDWNEKHGLGFKSHDRLAWQAACEWRDSQVGEPYAYICEFDSNIYEFDSKQFGVRRSFSLNQWNGLNPSRCVLVYTTPPAAQINQQLVEALQYAKRFLNSKDHDIEYIETTLAAAKETK